MPSTQDFRNELDEIFTQATNLGLCSVGIRSRDLHNKLNGNNEFTNCCNAMHSRKVKPKDEIIDSPRKGQGRNLIIQYELPR